jgi:hypothetical protein
LTRISSDQPLTTNSNKFPDDNDNDKASNNKYVEEGRSECSGPKTEIRKRQIPTLHVKEEKKVEGEGSFEGFWHAVPPTP